jgi:hypothetical protein
MTDMMTETLREEIRSFHAAQADLRKWKFVVIGTVAALGVGLAEHAGNGSRLALFILPFLALYPDMLVWDYDLRIAVITAFIRKNELDGAEYEKFVHEKMAVKNPWIFGQAAALVSTIIVSFAVGVMGGLFWFDIAKVPPAGATYNILPSFNAKESAILLLVSASGGVGLSGASWLAYLKRTKQILGTSNPPPTGKKF